MLVLSECDATAHGRDADACSGGRFGDGMVVRRRGVVILVRILRVGHTRSLGHCWMGRGEGCG